MSNHSHSSQTHGTWDNQPSYALGLKTVWKDEPLLIMISKVVLFVSLGVLLNSTEHTVTKGAIARPAFRGRFVGICGCFRPFSTSFQSYHPVSSHTRDPRANQSSYAIDLNTLWQEKQLPAML